MTAAYDDTASAKALAGQAAQLAFGGDVTELQTDIAAWSAKTNAKQRGVDWQFRIDNARTKLKRLYPKIKT